MHPKITVSFPPPQGATNCIVEKWSISDTSPRLLMPAVSSTLLALMKWRVEAVNSNDEVVTCDEFGLGLGLGLGLVCRTDSPVNFWTFKISWRN